MATALWDPPAPRAPQPAARDYLSFSALRTYQGCALRYYFKYVVGLPEGSVSAALVYGSAVHRAIEFHFRELLAGNPPLHSDALLAEFWNGWKDRELQQVRFGKDETPESLGALAERMLVAFLQSDAARPQGQILAVEEELRGPIVAGCPDLLARVDLIVDTEKELVITDWKTARSRWGHDQIEDASEQLLLYAELARDFAPAKPLVLEFVVLTKNKEVIVDRHRLPAEPAKIARIKRVVERVWRAIDSGSFYPAPSAMNCPSCPYRKACRTWQN